MDSLAQRPLGPTVSISEAPFGPSLMSQEAALTRPGQGSGLATVPRGPWGPSIHSCAGTPAVSTRRENPSFPLSAWVRDEETRPRRPCRRVHVSCLVQQEARSTRGRGRQGRRAGGALTARRSSLRGFAREQWPQTSSSSAQTGLPPHRAARPRLFLALGLGSRGSGEGAWQPPNVWSLTPPDAATFTHLGPRGSRQSRAHMAAPSAHREDKPRKGLAPCPRGTERGLLPIPPCLRPHLWPSHGPRYSRASQPPPTPWCVPSNSC